MNRINRISRMNRRSVLFLIGILLSLVLNLVLVSSLGVTPGRNSIDFKSDFSGEYDFSVVNSEKKDMHLNIHVQGDLSEFVSVSEKDFSIKSNEELKKINYEINLPQIVEPGLHKIEIIVSDISGVGSSGIGATLAVAMQVFVHVPYPGKYVDSELKIFGTKENKKFLIPVIGRGEEKINEISAEISIFDLDGEIVKILETNSVSLDTFEKKELLSEWDVDVEEGKYLAKAVIDYDGEQKFIEEEFEIGEFVLDLLQIFVEDFSLGEVAEFNLVLENKWNEQIDNAYAEMRIFDQEMQELADIKSATYDIPGKMRTTLFMDWDTNGIQKGLYNGNVILHYIGKKTQQDLKLDVEEDKITVIGLGYVISSDESGGSGLVSILLIIIGFLVLLNILWFVVLRKKVKK